MVLARRRSFPCCDDCQSTLVVRQAVYWFFDGLADRYGALAHNFLARLNRRPPPCSPSLPLVTQDTDDYSTWETRYGLLLWLSMLSLVPFDIDTIDSGLAVGRDAAEGASDASATAVGEKQADLVGTILTLGMKHLGDAGPTRCACACLPWLLLLLVVVFGGRSHGVCCVVCCVAQCAYSAAVVGQRWLCIRLAMCKGSTRAACARKGCAFLTIYSQAGRWFMSGTGPLD